MKYKNRRPLAMCLDVSLDVNSKDGKLAALALVPFYVLLPCTTCKEYGDVYFD